MNNFEKWWGTMKFPNLPTYDAWAQQIWINTVISDLEILYEEAYD